MQPSLYRRETTNELSSALHRATVALNEVFNGQKEWGGELELLAL